jgi:hypothetical protein
LASIFGHAAGAVIAWEAGRRLPGEWVPRGARWYAVPAVIAVLPDLDVVWPMFLRRSAVGYHRGPTHSVLVALAIAGCATLVVRACGCSVQRWRLFAVLTACALMHPVLDYLMGCGPPVPFLWPLTRRGWLSPVQLIPTAFYATRPSGFARVLGSPRTWAGAALEAASLGPLWLAIRGRGIRRVAWGIAAAGGFTATLLLYN